MSLLVTTLEDEEQSVKSAWGSYVYEVLATLFSQPLHMLASGLCSHLPTNHQRRRVVH